MARYEVVGSDGHRYEVEANSEADLAKFKIPTTTKGTEAREPASYSKQTRNVLEGLNAALRAGARGVPAIGAYTDEALATIKNDLPGGQGYDTELERIRSADKQFDTDYPKTSMGLQLGGGILGTLAALKVGGKVMPKTFGPKALEELSKSSRLNQIKEYAKWGAGGGAAEGVIGGFGGGEDGFANRVANSFDEAWRGGAVGGITGPLGMMVSGVAPAIGKLSTKAANMLRSEPKVSNIDKLLESVGIPSREQLKTFVDAAEADNALTTAGRKKTIGRAGENASVMDTGPGMQAIADYGVQQGGRGARMIRENIEDRIGQARGNLVKSLDTALGEPEGKVIREAAKRAAESPELLTAYKKAYSRLLTPDKALGKLVSQAGPEAHAYAKKLMLREGRAIPKDPSKSTMYMDYLTRSLNELPDNKGALGGMTALGRANTRLARDIRGKVRGMNKAYDEALGMGHDAISKKEALDFGYDMLKSNNTSAEIFQDMGDIHKGNEKIVGQGVREYINDVFEKVPKAINDPAGDVKEAQKALQLLSSRASMNKLATFMKPEEMNSLFTRLAEAERALSLKANVAGNSKTAQRIAQEKLDEATLADPGQKAAKTIGTGGIQQTAVKLATAPLSRGKAAQEALEESHKLRRAQFLTKKATAEGLQGPLQDLRRLKDLTRMEKNAELRTRATTRLTIPQALNSFIDSLKEERDNRQKRRP